MSAMRLLLLTPFFAACSADPDKSEDGADDGTTGTTGTTVVDGDGDGWSADEDCDDANPAVHPGASEVCDGTDNDCDDLVDEADDSLEDGETFYADADLDGYGDAATTSIACTAPAGTVSDATDCDDSDGAIHPAATEVCDGVDNDCDDLIDDDDDSLDPSTQSAGYTDADADGYGDPDQPVEACVLPDNAVADNTDCDDTSPDTNPGAAELEGDRLDNDCDPTTLDNPSGGTFSTGDAALSIAGAAPYLSVGDDIMVGDYNGDGTADVVLGSGSGWAFLHHGPVTPSTTVDSAAANFYAGDWPRTIMETGDLDGDGYDDLVFGGPSTFSNAGGGFLQYGPFSGSVDLLSAADAMVSGRDSATYMGKSVELLEDITGDGAMDWLVTAVYDDAGAEKAGAIYVYSGPQSGTLSLADADTTIYGTGSYQGYGGDAVAADVNGDGVLDFVSSDFFGVFTTGNIYVQLGPVSGSATTSDADAVYTSSVRAFGSLVKSLGDVNDDGYADLGSAAKYDDLGGGNSGSVSVIAGEAAPTGFDMVDATATIIGEAEEYLGNGLQGLGDYTLDGPDDIAVGSTLGRERGELGSAYIYEGPLSGTLTTDDAFIVIDGNIRRTYLGAGIATTPDLDGDARPELWIGASGEDGYRGRAYLFQSLDL